MPDFFLTLRKVLELEKNKGYTNQSVAGGFENFTEFFNNFQNLGLKSNKSIEFVANLFQTYYLYSLPDRQKIVEHLLEWLDKGPEKDISPISELVIITTERPNIKAKNTVYEQEKGLYADIRSISGIGEKNSKIFHKLGVSKIYDLLKFYPRRYQDYSKLIPINQIQYGDEISIIGKITMAPRLRSSKSGKLKIIESVINDGSGNLKISWFNKPFLTTQLKPEMTIIVSGIVDIFQGRFVLNNPEWETIDSNQLNTNRIVPIYPLSVGLTQRQVRRAIHSCLNIWSSRIKEYFPKFLLKDEKLLGINDAIRQIHYPDTEDSLKMASERFAFEEIFFLQLGVFLQKKEWSRTEARKFSINDELINKNIQSLPFILTDAQINAIHEIRADLNSGRPMNRLLQGDVGAGKTIVSRFAVQIIIENGSQAAIMAPTAILAEQHYRTFIDLFIGNNLLEPNEIALLIGSTSVKDRKRILNDLQSGQIKILIGTHAIIEDPVIFQDLQLAVIDEQHRFGVTQRALLRKKGNSPHLLVMTATPIPRSLALTIYGDLDITTINKMPEGRKPVNTSILQPIDREAAYNLIMGQIHKGFQAYIIYPLIESVDNNDYLAVVNEFERISKNIFPMYSVGLIHGKLKPSEKDQIMKDFRDRKFDILISTTVIEVGVDIPNATVVIIEGANRFGLAQLHQIRGRVGRSEHESFCILIPEEVNAVDNERLQAMTKTNDGFLLADFDLKQRGPGEFLGSRQSGYVGLRFANVTDISLIERCKTQSLKIIEMDPDLQKPENLLVKRELTYYWPDINLN